MSLQRGERQTRRTKEALITAFVQLIHEKNYKAVTIQDIADQVAGYIHRLTRAAIREAFGWRD